MTEAPKPTPPWPGQMPERWRNTPYDELPPGLQHRVDRALQVQAEDAARSAEGQQGG